MKHGLRRLGAISLALAGMLWLGAAQAAVEATTEPFRLSIKHDGIRSSAGEETLTYSGLWDGDADATVTIAQDGAVLAEGLTGEGDRAWSVRKTGVYSLTHTTYTNGVAGKVETATFVVPGPELSFEYDGGEFVGGLLTINGGLDGWTIHYTLDGSAPTAESSAYTGPFALSSAATVKAFAVSATGLHTPVLEQAYAVVEHARIENLYVRQRWMGGGKVDIDFDVVGDVSVGLPDGWRPYLAVKATDPDSGMTYAITAADAALTGDTGNAQGRHSVVWDLRAHGIDAVSDNMVFSVAYRATPLYCIVDLSGGEDAEEYPVSYESALPSEGFNAEDYKKGKLVLRLIEPGTFKAGGAHEVTLTRPFYMAVFETTQKQYAQVSGSNPSTFSGDTRPVENCGRESVRGDSDGSVWPDSTEVSPDSFMGRLNARTGLHFDLPTEAQWEYACRAGTTSGFNNGGDAEDDMYQLGRYSGNRSGGKGGYSQHTAVGSYLPNAWGLYDMHGNVFERCLDWYGDLSDGMTDPVGPGDGSKRVLRGGSYNSSFSACDSASRSTSSSDAAGVIGFRVSRTFGEGEEIDVVCSAEADSVAIDTRTVQEAPLAVKSLVAAPRQPYDGFVDIELEIDGTPEKVYETSFLVREMAGGEYYALNTFTNKEDGAAGNAFALTPGVHRFVWNLAADIPEEYRMASFALTVNCAETPRYMSVDLNGGKDAASYPISYRTGVPALGWQETHKTRNLVMRLLPAGTYMAQTQDSRYGNAKDQHLSSPCKITLTKPFYVGVFEITQAQFGNVCGSYPSYFKNANSPYYWPTRPVESVAWSRIRGATADYDWPNSRAVDPASFMGRLRTKTGIDFDLPTEAQWEYACRAGTTGMYYVNVAGATPETLVSDADFAKLRLARFSGNSGWGSDGGIYVPLQSSGYYASASGGTAAVGMLTPNAWGLYDMLGNVHEWVLGSIASGVDPEPSMQGASRIVRGGSWRMDALGCMCRFRMRDLTTKQDYTDGGVDKGFRVASPASHQSMATAPFAFAKDFPDDSIAIDAYSGKYDGAAHGIAVQSEIEGFKARYGLAPDGEFVEEMPTLTDAGGMTVWCAMSAPGYVTQTNSATVTIRPRAVTLTSGSAGKVYDGAALVRHEVAVGGDGFVDGEGAAYAFTGSRTDVGESANTFAYALDEGTKAGNYEITTANGTLAVTKATVGGGDDEPGGGETPQGGLSKFDATCVYDGEGHTIDSDALAAAFGAAMIGECAVAYARDDGSGEGGGLGQPALPWDVDAPVYTNAGEYVVWYRVSNPNYEDFIHAAKVTITKRPVTVTSGDGAWVYDGRTHGNASVTADGFVAGEGVVADGFADITDVGTVANAFGYTFAEGTRADNYAVTCVTGTLVVTAAEIGGWTDEAKWTAVLSGDGAKYDGMEKTCDVASIAYDGFPIPTFTVTGNSATDAGAYTLTVRGTGNFAGTHDVPWSIRPRAVTLTSGSAGKVYDGAALVRHEVSVGGDGFVDGDGAAYAFTGSQTDVGESANTFAYALDEGTKAGNYEITTASGTLTVTKATVGGGDDEPGGGETTSGGLSKFDVTCMYDGEGHTIDTDALAAAFGAAMIGEIAVAYARDDGSGEGGRAGRATLPWGVDAPVCTNAGEYVVWYRVSNPNYEDFIHAAKVTITNRPVTVVVTGRTATFTYDTTEKRVAGCEATTEDDLYDIAADTAFGGGFIETALPGAVLGGGSIETARPSVVFGGCSAVRTDVGTSAMGLAADDFANNNANFLVTYEVTDGWVKIEPRVIGDDPANWDIRLGRAAMYDGTEKSAPIIQVCYVKPDGNLDAIPYTLSGDTATDAGNYTLRITGTGNYAGAVEKEWAITPRNVSLASGRAVWVYDGAAHSQTAVTVGGDGFAEGEGAAYAGFPVVTHVADASEPIANDFTYTLNAGTKAGNYEITTVRGTVQMTPRAITLTAPTKDKTYDGVPLTFGAGEIAATLNGDGGGFIETALPKGEAFTFSDFASLTEAGRVEATFAVSDGTARLGDYAITVVPGTLTVLRNATEITVTAKSGRWVYDGMPHTLHEYEATNLGALIAWDVLAVEFDEVSVVTTPLDGPEGDGTVPNTIIRARVMRGDSDVTANYTLATYPGTLTVAKRPVTLTSKSDTKVYDGEPLTAHEVTVGGDGFVGNDGATYTFTGTQTEKGVSKNTFAYALKGGTNGAFYDITTVEGNLEVTPLDLSDGAGEADWQITRGPALVYTGLEQIQTLAAVSYKGLPLDYSVTGNAQTDAGDYELTLTGQGNFTGEKRVAWSIAPKPLTLTAGSGSRVYDGTPFTVGTVTADGFVAGEGAAYTCGGSQTDAGSSANDIAEILWNANTKGSNYAVTKVAGTLTVTPRPVTLTAANLTKPYDGIPLALTAADIAADGMAPGESFVFSDFASRTEAGQTPATFAYAAGAGTKLENYVVTVTPGCTLTVTKSATAISVTAASETWVYDGEAHSNRTWTATNLDTLQPGDALEVSFDEASVVTTPQDGPAANTITEVRVVRRSGGSQSSATEDVTANYTVEWFPGTLAVTKRPVTVTVTGRTAAYAYDGTEKTVTGCEATTDDDLYDIAADTVFSGGFIETARPGAVFGGCSAVRTDVGTTAMGLTADDFTNNNACFDVTYAVTDGWVKIAPFDIAAADDGDFAIALGANPTYNGTVQTIPVAGVTCRGLDVAYTLAGENATHAGTYTLTVKGVGNFTGERSTTWQILKRRVTLTSGSARKAYDGTALVNARVDVGGDGFIGLEGAMFDVTGSQTVAGASPNTFTYALKAGTLSGDYDITTVEGDLVVTKAKYPGQEDGGAGIQWSVAADAAVWMYDGRPHGVSLTGVPAGVTVRLTDDTATDAGDYTAVASFEYDAANYEPPVFPAPLAWRITKRPISLQTVNAEKPYDGFPLAVEAANITPGLSGYADGECFEYFDFASITEVGETAATFAYRDSATAKVSNYAVTVIGGATLKVTVGGDQISVTARDGTWAYDGETHRLAEWDIVNADKLLAGHAFQIKVRDDSAVTTPEDGEARDGVVSNRFEYVRIVETATGADRTRNYNLFVYEGRLQVTNACVAAEALDGTARIEKVYDGVATGAVVTAALLQPATVRYSTGGSQFIAIGADAMNCVPPAFTDAGVYTVWYEVTAPYYNAYTGRVDVAIAKRPVTLTSPTKTKPYDGAPLTFGMEEIAVTLNGDGGGFVETALPAGESFAFSNFASITDAGRVEATFDYAAGGGTSLDNYDVTVVNGTLTVNASADEITVTAKSGRWPYDGAAHTLHACEIENGDVLRDGDELVVEYDPASVVATPDDGEVENRIVSVKVMRRTGGSQSSATEDVTRNYSIAVYPGTLRVVNAEVLFGAVDPAAFSTEAVYDGETHTIAVTSPHLLTAPVTVEYLGETSTEAGRWTRDPLAAGAKDAGTHTIRYRISARYYNDCFGEATVTIAPRPVTLLSASARKVYDGTPLRADRVSVKGGSLGFVDGEGVTAVCTSAQTGVGGIENGFTYEFNDGTRRENYTIMPEFGWLEVTPGTLAVDVEGSFYTGVYDGRPHGVAPVFSGTGLNLEACEITYALVSGDESAYSPEMPVFIDVGTYTVYVKIKAHNFEVAYAEMTVTITKATVEPPEIASKVYNGEVQTADVPASPLWSVSGNKGGKEVGEHDLVLKLVDSKNYKWAPKDGVTVTSSFAFMTFTITKQGNNEWTTEPSIESWRTDEQAKQPVAAARYGSVTVEYRGTLTSGETYANKFPSMNPGSYTACFTVKETADYAGLYREVPFTVTEKTVEPINVKATGYLGIYDGKPHAITLTVTGGSGTPTVTYATAKDGDYAAENPSFTETGIWTVWYKVVFPNFAPIEGSAVVSISPGSGGEVRTHTATTPVPVPYAWLEPYRAAFGGGDYEAAGNATGRNGCALWESYVAGLDPTRADSVFRAFIRMTPDREPEITWSPDLSKDAETPRTYTTLGKARLDDKADWTPVTERNKAQMRFFKVTVEIK